MSLVRLDLLAPPFFAAAVLLVLSGAAKLRDPGPAARALTVLRLPSYPWTIRILGTVELATGMWCLIGASRASAVSVAILYGAFAVFVALQMRTGTPGATCGCLGKQEAPPSLLHLGLNMVAAGTAAVVATAPPIGIVAYAARLPLRGLPFLLGIALMAYLAYLAVAYLPQAFWSFERTSAALDRAARARPFVLRRRGTP